MIRKGEKDGVVVFPGKLRNQKQLEDVVATVEREIRDSEKETQARKAASPSNGRSLRTRPMSTDHNDKEASRLLNLQAHKVAEALWVYQYAADTEDGSLEEASANGDSGVPSTTVGEASKALISRAQAILHRWRFALKEGDSIQCPDFMDEYEFNDENRGFVKLFDAIIKEVALAGTSVPLGDSSSPKKQHQLLENERAIFVHYKGYPNDQNRWIVIKRDNPLSGHVLPKDSHVMAWRAIQAAHPDGKSVNEEEAPFPSDSQSVEEEQAPLPSDMHTEKVHEADLLEDDRGRTRTSPDVAKLAPASSPSCGNTHDSMDIAINNDTGRSSRRCKRKREARTSEKKRPATKKSSRATSIDMAWICTECNEAECLANPEANLILCEGKCNRPFHYPCANLPAMPSSEENWICDDCQKECHQCAICQQYGADDEDVFCCDKKGCGLFFHESCLSMQNVEVEINETRHDGVHDAEPIIISKPRFTCPAHSCWTCTEDYVPPDDDDDEEQKKKRGKGHKKGSSCFARKSDSLLHRCLHCPIAYHITCIPPMARFHELCLLCHEHAGSNKLPYLDIESSIQGELEAQVEKKLAKIKKGEVRLPGVGKKADTEVMNPFFPGIVGDSILAHEERFLSYLQKEGPEHEYLTEGLPFCLPCDIQEEVHSKPPSYRHVHSLRYNPSNRPKRLPPSDGICECKSKKLSVCDESCLNRMVMIECVGDVTKSNGEKNPYWNCDLGPSCTNRSMAQRNFATCKPTRERGKGWGLVTVNGVKRGGLVQEYVGEVIDEAEKKARLQQWARDHPNDPNFYVMQLDTGWYIDARHEANLSRFINHSCDPNCRLVPLNVGGYMRVGVFSLRDIDPGEFLSYDYQFDTKFGDRFRCRCGAATCRGTMKGGKMDDVVEQKTRKEEWADAKARYERHRKYLEEAEETERERASQVDALVPGAENALETVAAGPNFKYRETARSNKIFLWRNAVQGGDFAARSRSAQKANGKSKRKNTMSTTTVDLITLLFKKTPERDNSVANRKDGNLRFRL